MAPQAAELAIFESQLRHWQLLEEFRTRLDGVFKDYPLRGSFADPRRRLTASDYLSLYLFGLFNPVVKTMRGLCEASRLARVQEEVCSRAVSLGSFSEAQHVLEPALLEKVFADLSQHLSQDSKDTRLGQWQWLARDGSLFRALPRMHWALYGAGRAGFVNNAVRLHVSLNVVADTPKTVAVRVGKQCERAVWREQWRAGEAYIGDRYFAEDYKVFDQLDAKGCAYVLRLREPVAINIETELPLTEADQQAGVLRQVWARLGARQRYRSARLRIVWVRTAEGNTLLLATNLTPGQLSAELVWLLYKKRWRVELFFRWIKCILKCANWLSESSAGVNIQIYLALIAGLLLQLYTGRRPAKRLMELFQFHQMGYVTSTELEQRLRKERERLEQKSKA